jgi:peptidylprolyl isomerase
MAHPRCNRNMETLTVTLHTNQGDIGLKLFPEVAPKACENFATHAEKGYYDGVIFHRVIAEFMIQGGDPDGTGMGGESIWGKPFEDECTADHKFDRPGLLAMANAGPSTNGSQFFITCAATPWLNMRHTIFGEVVEGMDVVKKIENCEVGRSDRPVENIEIKNATVAKA